MIVISIFFFFLEKEMDTETSNDIVYTEVVKIEILDF